MDDESTWQACGSFARLPAIRLLEFLWTIRGAVKGRRHVAL
jgi:hypothetical protein